MNPNASAYEPYAYNGQFREDDTNQGFGDKLIAASSDVEMLLQHDRRLQQPRPPPRQSRLNPQNIRLAIRFIELLLDLSTVALHTYAASVWWKTRDNLVDNNAGQKVVQWPHTNMWPTWTMLGTGAVTALSHILSFLTYLAKFRRMRQGAWRSRAVYAKSVLVSVGWSAALAYFKMSSVQGPKTRHWDLWSWSCHVKDEQGDIPWNALCTEMNYTFNACVVVVPLEIMGLLVYIFAQRKSKRRGKYQRAGSAVH
ncbi:hypothetical protein FDECE_10460 [Fusarium decemcellulare]|nr:hypothetical protein FDECE_10460 [Fusarium decemcellulare]